MTTILTGLVNDLGTVLIKWNTAENVSTILQYFQNVLTSLATVLSTIQ